jgi:hypothetical protein
MKAQSTLFKSQLFFLVMMLLTIFILNGCTSFHDFVMMGDLEEVRAGLDSGVDPNTTNIYAPCSTALMEASMYGHLEIVKLLVEKGAEVDAIGTHDYTALGLACKYRRSDIVKYLVEKGAEVNPKEGKIPLLCALEYPSSAFRLKPSTAKDYTVIVKCLLEKGAETTDGGSILHGAALNAVLVGNTEVLELLKEKGIVLPRDKAIVVTEPFVFISKIDGSLTTSFLSPGYHQITVTYYVAGTRGEPVTINISTGANEIVLIGAKSEGGYWTATHRKMSYR